MDIIEKLQNAHSAEEIEQYLLDLDSEFRFKCHRCGKCCMNQDTLLLTPRDIFNIAKKLGVTLELVIKLYAEVCIDRSSQIPLVNMVPVGRQRRCPLLMDDGRCRVYDCKPTVCTLFPVGRVGDFQGTEDSDKEITRENMKIRYILNDYSCGSAQKVNTIRSWLARFNIPEEDEFFIQWSVATANLGTMMQKLKNYCSEPTMGEIQFGLFWILYVDYDTQQDFMPQFEQTVNKINKFCTALRELGGGNVSGTALFFVPVKGDE